MKNFILILFLVLFQTVALANLEAWNVDVKKREEMLRLLHAVLYEHPMLQEQNYFSGFRRRFFDAYMGVEDVYEVLGDNAAKPSIDPTTMSVIRYSKDLQPGEVNFEKLDELKETLRRSVNNLPEIPMESFDDFFSSARTIANPGNEKAVKKTFTAIHSLAPFLFSEEMEPKTQAITPAFKEELLELINALDSDTLATLYTKDFLERYSGEIDIKGTQKGFGLLGQTYKGFKNNTFDKLIVNAQNQGGNGASVRTLSLEKMPPLIGMLRGACGDDCSLYSLPYFSLMKGSDTYFIRKSANPKDKIEGYILIKEYEINGEKIPYLLSFGGRNLTEDDVVMATTEIGRRYGHGKVIAPNFANNFALAEHASVQGGFKKFTSKTILADLAEPEGWDKIQEIQRKVNNFGYSYYFDWEKLKSAHLIDTPPPSFYHEVSEIDLKQRYHAPKPLSETPKEERLALAVFSLIKTKQNRSSEADEVERLKIAKAQILEVLEITESEYELAEKHFREANILDYRSAINNDSCMVNLRRIILAPHLLQ